MLLISVTLVIYATIRVSAGWRRQLLPVAVGPWWLERYPYYSYTVEDLLCGSSISKITASGIWDAEKWEIVKALLVSCLSHSRSCFSTPDAPKSKVSLEKLGDIWWHLYWFRTHACTWILKTHENVPCSLKLKDASTIFQISLAAPDGDIGQGEHEASGKDHLHSCKPVLAMMSIRAVSTRSINIKPGVDLGLPSTQTQRNHC